MNEAHYHLLLNHLPILGVLFGVLLLGSGFLTKSVAVLKAGMTTILVSALLTAPAYFTGEAAEKVVEKVPGVQHDDLENHEEIGELGLWIMVPAGGAALLGLMNTDRCHSRSGRYKKPRTWAIVTFIVGIMAFAVMAWAGVTGGMIRHSELRAQPTAVIEPGPK